MTVVWTPQPCPWTEPTADGLPPVYPDDPPAVLAWLRPDGETA